MRLQYALVALATISLACADTLTLRNGRVVQGSFLGGSPRQIRMAVGDRVETFDVGDVASLQFEGGASAAAVAAPAVPAPAVAATPVAQVSPAPAVKEEAAPQRRIMRPDPVEGASAPAVAAAPAGSELAAGTMITVRMIDDVDSENVRPGQTFRASVDEPVMAGDRTLIPRGADVLTKLVEVKDPSKLTGGGQLTLDLVSVVVNGKPVEVNTADVTTTGESRKKQTGAVVGGTAALGAVIGAIAGGGKGAAIGAISGAGAGTAIQVMTKGTRVRIPSETRLTFTLQQPVRL